MTKQPKKKRSKKIESRDERMVGMLVEELRTFFQDLKTEPVAPALPVAEANRFVQLVVIPPQNEYSGGSGQLYGLTRDGRVYVHKGSRTTYADGNWVRVPTLLVDPPPPSQVKRSGINRQWLNEAARDAAETGSFDSFQAGRSREHPAQLDPSNREPTTIPNSVVPVAIPREGAKPHAVGYIPSATNPRHEPAPVDSVCQCPTPEGFRAAIKTNPQGPITDADLPKCGKSATVRITTTYTNGKIECRDYCEKCRPRQPPVEKVDRGPLHHEWSAGPMERGFEFVVGSPRVGHRTILDRAEAKEVCGMLEAWLHEESS